MTDPNPTDIEYVSGADVTAAEAAAEEAAALVAALEERVKDGDDEVTPDQIAASEGLSRFARLRAEATRRKADASAASARVRAMRALKAEIEDYAATSSVNLVTLLAEVDTAARAFIAASEDEASRLDGWRRRLEAFDVPRMGSPYASHEGLGWSAGGDVIAGDLLMPAIDGSVYLGLLFSNRHDDGRLAPTAETNRADLFSDLSRTAAGRKGA